MTHTPIHGHTHPHTHQYIYIVTYTHTPYLQVLLESNIERTDQENSFLKAAKNGDVAKIDELLATNIDVNIRLGVRGYHIVVIFIIHVYAYLHTRSALYYLV